MDDPTIVYKYTTSLHWSFTQFTPASMEVHPHNALERIYAIVILMSALVVFSSFVSGITAAMTALRQMNMEQTRESDNVRKYITDRKISLELGNRIHSCLRKQGYAPKHILVENDVAALKRLPPSVLLDLHAEVYSPCLLPHPFFHQFYIMDEMAIIEICHCAMKDQVAVKGQRIFTCGNKAIEMRCVSEGTLNYFSDGEETSTPIISNDYVSEACLWLRWVHQGDLESVLSSVLINLVAVDFHNVVVKTVSYNSCAGYAQQYLHRMLASARPTGLDVWYEFDAIQEMAQRAFERQELEMSQDSQAQLSSPKATSGSLVAVPVRRMMKLLQSRMSLPL